jgi:hypothetical protein
MINFALMLRDKKFNCEKIKAQAKMDILFAAMLV